MGWVADGPQPGKEDMGKPKHRRKDGSLPAAHAYREAVAVTSARHEHQRCNVGALSKDDPAWHDWRDHIAPDLTVRPPTK